MYVTVYVGGVQTRSGDSMARGDRGQQTSRAGRSGRVALKGASDWRGHAALQGRWSLQFSLEGMSTHAGPSCGYSVQLGCDLRTGCCSGAATAGRGRGRGHHPGTQAPEAEEWLVARLGRPRLTWRIGSEQVLSRTMSKGGPYKCHPKTRRLVLPAVHTFGLKKAIS
jgi:hypothetical protein